MLAERAVSVCRSESCRAQILWAKTAGRPMPLDPEPSPNGNIALVNGVAVVFKDREAAALAGMDATLYTSHFVTCPGAKEHRKK